MRRNIYALYAKDVDSPMKRRRVRKTQLNLPARLRHGKKLTTSGSTVAKQFGTGNWIYGSASKALLRQRGSIVYVESRSPLFATKFHIKAFAQARGILAANIWNALAQFPGIFSRYTAAASSGRD